MFDSRKLLELDKYVKEKVNEPDIVALNVSLISSLQVWSCSYGLKQFFPSEEPNSLDTYYDLGELSEIVTKFLILTHIYQKNIFLDDPINNYLKDFQNKDITISMCLNHTSSLKEIKGSDKDDIVNDLYKGELSDTGSSKSECLLLGLILSKLEGSYTDAIEHLCSTYNLKHLTSLISYGLRSNCARSLFNIEQGVSFDQTAVCFNGESGANSVFSSIQDFSMLVKIMISKGLYRKNQVIDDMDLKQVLNGLKLNRDHYMLTSSNGCTLAIHKNLKYAIVIFAYLENAEEASMLTEKIIDKAKCCI